MRYIVPASALHNFLASSNMRSTRRSKFFSVDRAMPKGRITFSRLLRVSSNSWSCKRKRFERIWIIPWATSIRSWISLSKEARSNLNRLVFSIDVTVAIWGEESRSAISPMMSYAPRWAILRSSLYSLTSPSLMKYKQSPGSPDLKIISSAWNSTSSSFEAISSNISGEVSENKSECLRKSTLSAIVESTTVPPSHLTLNEKQSMKESCIRNHACQARVHYMHPAWSHCDENRSSRLCLSQVLEQQWRKYRRRIPFFVWRRPILSTQRWT